MEPRKIIKFGNSSYVVTLPATWLERNKLEKGDTISLSEKEDSLIICSNNKTNQKIATLSIDDKPLKLFNKELLSYYLKNFKTIEITGEDVLSRIDEIRIFKEKLSSVEITELTKEKVVLKDLTAPSELDVHNLIKQIIDMEKVIFDELTGDDVKSKYTLITQLDKNINKLSFLAHKAVNYNLDSWDHPEQIKDAIHYWRIVANFEEIGDIIKRVARYLKNETKEHNHHIGLTIEKVKDYFDFVTGLLEENINFDNNLKLYLDKKQSLLRELEGLRESLKDNLNLFLVITQLLKDLVGNLDTVILSIIDLKLK